jgi:hypothetical protein
MFDLEEAIRNWRRQMAADGITNVKVLNELESHVRDDVEQHVTSGIETEQAFESAIGRIGQAQALRTEFAKVRTLRSRTKQAILAFAGVSDHYTTMNTPQINPGLERAWVTYLKSAAWLFPALSLWAVSTIWAFPKLKEIMRDAGLNTSFTRIGLGISDLYINYGILILLTAAVTFALLEWRSNLWPRYRRALLGFGVFVLNSMVLVLLVTMLMSALMAAPALFHGQPPARSASPAGR